MRSALTAIALFVLSGCDTPSRHYQYTNPNGPSGAQLAPAKKTIQIISEPPGARIEVNDDYVGDAPRSIEFPCDPEGRFIERTRIVALPVGFGYTQRKLFLGYPYTISSLKGDKIPSRILFDMRLRPVSTDINVNVNE